MSPIDDLNMIKPEIAEGIRNVMENPLTFLEISENFAAKERKTTLEVLDIIKDDVKNILVDRHPQDVNNIANLAWKYFVQGFDAGKNTYEYKL